MLVATMQRLSKASCRGSVLTAEAAKGVGTSPLQPRRGSSQTIWTNWPSQRSFKSANSWQRRLLLIHADRFVIRAAVYVKFSNARVEFGFLGSFDFLKVAVARLE